MLWSEAPSRVSVRLVSRYGLDNVVLLLHSITFRPYNRLLCVTALGVFAALIKVDFVCFSGDLLSTFLRVVVMSDSKLR